MKVIIWNCKMKFREDLEKIFPLEPDVLVISEVKISTDSNCPERYSNAIDHTDWR